jgi:hypothetical protein
VTNFDGKIVVFGHHPPVTDDATGAMPWDVVPSWKEFRPYFSNTDGKSVVLWIFGHVHDYQRRSKTPDSNVQAPVLLIAGGGGASLDVAPGTYQWQPDGWNGLKAISSYSYVKVSLKQDSAEIKVFI